MEKVTMKDRVEAVVEIFSAIFFVVFMKIALVVGYCVETAQDWWSSMLDRYYYIKIEEPKS